jgi:hypothetical protein
MPVIVGAAAALARGPADSPVSKALAIELEALRLLARACEALDPLLKLGLYSFNEHRSLPLPALAYLEIISESSSNTLLILLAEVNPPVLLLIIFSRCCKIYAPWL